MAPSIGLSDQQFTLFFLASIPVLARTVIMFLYPGTNPLQNNLVYLLLFSLLSVSSIYVYYRITA